MAEEQSKRLPLEHLQWRFFFIPDYSEEESVVVMKIGHSLADGIANVMMIAHLNDTPSVQNYPSIMPALSYLQHIVIALCLPFGLLAVIAKMALLRNEKNGFKNKEICS